ncbi:hypothetical protein Kpol_1052p16 [Vanderwaltozyma polyspora DSM 70294]|uniref:Amino acid permease/ SLC12A domain-containing protein n=1 Tax=Vanderwaltozyma polyspora (strain ATCC 22028 / DSM 70294 / BCRC 21397 / CBS 2163 / NBRC 10782 / NRRL Y-8283 / UCD 57-17) TaxID=436907 RepID=A7TM27_VANPO|nr:uncharacterized protein Kpol_1052p16 [Vanderwaltozyma polyspora DSM 70294]EDO16669.1 hypothetical protein Kpol_1052p16 [Vanderwaltozyma polyspora DSM 70294]
MKRHSIVSSEEKISDVIVSESTTTTGSNFPSNQRNDSGFKSFNDIDTSERTSVESSEVYRSGRIRRWIDSYKRAEHPREHIDGFEDGESKDGIHLKKQMKTRHVVMMSLGTGIGTGLLIANAKGLHFAGPAPLVIGYGMVSFVTYFMIQAAGELAVAYPTLPGNFNSYFGILISKPFGFATVWLAAVQWLTVLPLEFIAASLTIKYWNDRISGDVFVVIFYVFLLFIHFVGVRAYGETEFIFNLCKVLMIIGFIILSIVINAGGAGNDGYIGGKYWNDPGAFAGETAGSRFKGVCYILVTGYFSYGGTELFVLSVNEQENPRKSTPQAAKHSIYRIVIIYLLTMILIGFNVPYNDPRLMGADDASGSHASPYVLAASIHGVKIVPHFINAVVLIALISVGNSALYAAPRMMVSLAEQGFAPKIMAYVDREGRPLVSLGICALFGLIGFAASSSKEEQVFTWLAAIAGLSELFTWSAFFISHIRFRWAMKLQGKDIKEVGFLASTGLYGSFYGLFFNILVFAAQFWVALSPIGSKKVGAESFFESYLAFPIWLFFYFGYMVWAKDFTFLNPLESIDLDFHRRIYDPEEMAEINRQEKEEYKNSSIVGKIIYWLC